MSPPPPPAKVEVPKPKPKVRTFKKYIPTHHVTCLECACTFLVIWGQGYDCPVCGLIVGVESGIVSKLPNLAGR